MLTKTCSSLLLLLCLTVQALADHCPEPGRLPTTCDCEDEGEHAILSCSGATIEELKDSIAWLDKSSRFEVELDDMVLDPLPSDIFLEWNIVKLDISHCELHSLSYPGHKALAGLEDKLEELVIVASFTEEDQYTKIDLSHLKRLTHLDLSYNAITELSDDWFANGPENLETLVLSNNGIDKLGDNAFANLANLEELELHGNRFGPLKRSMLPKSADRLAKLELDNNDFTSLPDDLFTDMPELIIVSIRTNRIKHLQERLWKPIWSKLEILDVRGNPLECDSSMEWMHRAKSDAVMVLGTCEGPSDREGTELEDFMKND